MFDIKQYKRIDLSLPLLVLITCLYGLLIIYTASGGNFHPFVYKQALHIAIAIPLLALICVLDIRLIYHSSYIVYAATIVLLLLVEVLGVKVMGAKRWINIGVRYQPSEIAKIGLILFLAHYFHYLSHNDLSLKNLLKPIMATIIPCILIMKQPDLGTAVILLSIATMMFFIAGVSIGKFLSVFCTGIALLPILWGHLYDYQKKRIFVFLNPEQDRLGSGYNIIQSKIAVGSGHWFGNGFLNGTQNQLNFLPESHTDFIFACIAEEFGFMGCSVLLVLYILIIWKCVVIITRTTNIFSKLLVSGIVAMFFLHICINISMVTGMLPVVGVPLPLISYGGATTISIMIGFAIITNIESSNKKFKYASTL